MPRGGRRQGAGRPRKSLEQHRRQRTRPNYPVKKPKVAERRSGLPRRRFFIYGGLNLEALDICALCAAIDDVWDDELAAQWPPENAPYSAYVQTPRQVAGRALVEFAKQWWNDAGPEWALNEGVPVEAIVDTWGRAPDRSAEVYRPPDAGYVHELISSGWLRRWWTYRLSPGETG